MHTWPYVTSLRPNVFFVTTKISKQSCVACVQHLRYWVHSTCSLCTAHVLSILFVTTFTNYLTICLTVMFTYVMLVQIPNSQNIHKWELWTCDNNELTRHLRSKKYILREYIYFIFREWTESSCKWFYIHLLLQCFWLHTQHPYSLSFYVKLFKA